MQFRFDLLLHVESPVYHAHAVFPEEQKLLTQTIRFNPSAAADVRVTNGSSRCAYFFRRNELVYNTSATPPLPLNLGTTAARVIQPPRKAGLDCVRVNTLTAPSTAPAHLLSAAFARVLSLMDAQATQAGVQPGRGPGPHAGRWGGWELGGGSGCI